jgi:hypothetical protein
VSSDSPWRSLSVLLALAAGFVLFTAGPLPVVVASHFGAGGGANGFMPRDAYVMFMLALVVGLPTLLTGLAALVRLLPVERINLPDRDYWLAPERQEETVAYLERHGARLAAVLAVFLCFVHWLVVKANVVQPARFPEPLFYAGVAVFATALALWLAGFLVHFGRRR